MNLKQTLTIFGILAIFNGNARYDQSNFNFSKPTNTSVMQINYAYTILYVENVPQTLNFYKNVFGFEVLLLTPEEDYGELKSGSTTLAFANMALGTANFGNDFKKSDPNGQPFGVELAFTTTEVDQLMEKAISYGATLLKTSETKPWGQTVGYIRDINGFIIEICTTITP